MPSRQDGESAKPLALVELRRLWDEGRRGPAIQAYLTDPERLAARPDDLHWLQDALRRVGLETEAFALQARIARGRAQEREWHSLIASVLRSGDPWWARALLEEAGSGSSRALQALKVEADLALGNAAASISAWLAEHRDAPALEAAVVWWVRAGRVEEAARIVEQAPELTEWRARLALWRNQAPLAGSILESLPSSPAVRLLGAVAAAQVGHLQEAESALKALLDTDVRLDAWTWLATVLRKQGRYDEARQAADAANSLSAEFNLVVALERALAIEYQKASGSRPGAPVQLRTVGDIEHAWALAPLGLDPGEPIGRLEEVIERFAGNHTPHLTLAHDGTLSSYPLPQDPAELAVDIQLVLRTRGAEAVRGLYRELAPQVGGHPRFRIYQGEIELWMGAYEEAARIFREVLTGDSTVMWAWIGLGASAMLQGELDEAQETWKRAAAALAPKPFLGPTIYVYRGECYRRQGDLGAARRDLEEGLRHKPQRLSSWINLALLDEQGALRERVERKCAELAPLLMEQLSGSTADRLEQVLEAMRGNRSSSRVTYHLWGQVWHFITQGDLGLSA